MAVTCNNLVLVRGAFELRANWTLDKGKTLALIGPSGAGKSLFLGGLAGFDRVVSGRIEMEGRDVTQAAPHDRPITLMFQDHNLFPHLTLLQNVGLGLDPGLKLDAPAKMRIEAALDAVGLAGLSARFPKELSGGQQSRAALARALIRNRPILALDEPFSALGPGMRRDMLDLVARIRDENGLTVILVTHSPQDARIADVTSLVHAGQVHAPQETNALFDDPPEALRDYL